jgi:hypothetical protein
MKRLLGLGIICAVVATLIGCPAPGTKKSLTITDIGWVLENIDLSHWTDGFNSATCFGWFTIVYSGDIAIDDIQYARFHKVGDPAYWSFPIDSTSVDIANRRIHSYLNYTTSIAANGSAFPIGQLEFEVGLRDGYTTSYVFDVPAPGQLTSGGKNVVYTEDYVGTPGTNYAAMIRRPNCTAQNKSATIGVSFNTSDALFFGGYVMFFDNADTVVGESSYFRAYGTGTVASFVNGGAGIYNNGGSNNLVIQPSDISFAPGKTFSDITKYSVRLTDGAQYLGTGHTFDCLSVGPTIAF